MGCLGVHFAITEAEVAKLRSIDESERPDYVHETIEEGYFSDRPDLLAQSDKSWDAMHRTLADGELTWDGGEYPLSHVVLAGELLYTESDFILTLKTPQQVRDIAAALAPIDEQEFRKRYNAIDADSYGMELSDEDFEYTWSWFQEVRRLYVRAAELGRYVIFTADQ